MNEIAKRTQDLIAQVRGVLEAPLVWAATPLGHTEYQVRNFIIPRSEHPTNAAQYRQVICELWARMKVAIQAQDGLEDIEVDLMEARATIAWTPWARRRKTLRISRLERNMRMLQLDLEQRIIRETAILIEMAQSLAPTLDEREAFTMAQEAKMWALKAKTQPKLAGLLGAS